MMPGSAAAGGVGSIVVKKGAHVRDEIRIVGHLNHYVGVGSGFLQVVPDQDGVDGALGLEVDGHALHAFLQLDEGAVGAGRVAVGNHFEGAEDGIGIAA
jgi:hypothetical protein